MSKSYQKEYRDNITDEQEQKRREANRQYQKKYRDNMSDEQKQKQKDYQKEYRKKYYAAKKLNKFCKTFCPRGWDLRCSRTLHFILLF